MNEKLDMTIEKVSDKVVKGNFKMPRQFNSGKEVFDKYAETSECLYCFKKVP